MGTGCSSTRRMTPITVLPKSSAESGHLSADDNDSVDQELSEIDQVLKTKDLERVGPDLGEGSFGRVIRVKHLTDSQEYAVKIIVCTSKKNKQYQERELKILAICTHENIVRYYDSWRHGSKFRPVLYIRMELCCKSLELLLLEQHLLVDKEYYLDVFPQILRGLEFIHGKGWMHRDINPLNILIAMQDTPSLNLSSLLIKITDFGLAIQFDHQPPSPVDTCTSNHKKLSSVGNKLYRAPEMYTGNYNYKVDMYSAGLVLYRLCRYFKSNEEIAPELEAIKQSGPYMYRSKMTHSNEFLFRMLCDLLHADHKRRPSASKALKRFDKDKSSSTTVVACAANDSANSSSEEDDAPDLC